MITVLTGKQIENMSCGFFDRHEFELNGTKERITSIFRDADGTTRAQLKKGLKYRHDVDVTSLVFKVFCTGHCTDENCFVKNK